MGSIDKLDLNSIAAENHRLRAFVARLDQRNGNTPRDENIF
jgi:hypothetical protein